MSRTIVSSDLFIDGHRCTFATVEIRDHIDKLSESNVDFKLPLKYSYDLVPAVDGGYVAKIRYRKILLKNKLFKLTLQRAYSKTDSGYYHFHFLSIGFGNKTIGIWLLGMLLTINFNKEI